MFDLCSGILAENIGKLNIILLIGIAVLSGTIAAKLFQRLHIPQVVAYVLIGIIIGNSVLNLVPIENVVALRPFTMFALGIIGFTIGGELRREIFRRHGKEFFIILLSQGLGAFILVSVAGTITAWLFTGDLRSSMVMGILLGAIGSATAPAATVNVLWEYKTRGPLTTTVLAIVALDDGLALLLYRAATAAGDVLMGTGNGSVLLTVAVLLAEIVGAVIFGFVVGFALYFILKLVRTDELILTFAVAAILLVVGVSMAAGIDPILPAMVLGVTTANIAPRMSQRTFGLITRFSPPVYVLFFVLAGAHIEFSRVALWLVVMVIMYALSRGAGKILGSLLGSRYSKAPEPVRKYLGICLLPQAGVAIGLAILAGQRFNSELGHAIIVTVMTATFIMEVVGPSLVKLGVEKAGEVGLNVTEEDLIKKYHVGDVMNRKIPTIAADTTLTEIIRTFGNTDSFYYPVVDRDKQLIGAVTVDGIRNTLNTMEVQQWLIALDILEPVITKTTPKIPLDDALEQGKRQDLEYLPVVASQGDNTFVGVLDIRSVHRMLSAEVMARQHKADEMHNVG
jgi:Kef-type K+ transport system membrane component KefB